MLWTYTYKNQGWTTNNWFGIFQCLGFTQWYEMTRFNEFFHSDGW